MPGNNRRPSLLLLAAMLAVCLCVPVSHAGADAFDTFRDPHGQPARLALDFSLPSLQDNSLSLTDYRGKLVLVNFWATWCAPCGKEMPGMEALYQRFKGRGLVVLAVAVDDGSKKRVKAFVEKYRLSFPVVLDPDSQVSDLYEVAGLPATYLIDAQGMLKGHVTGIRDWNSPEATALIEAMLP